MRRAIAALLSALLLWFGATAAARAQSCSFSATDVVFGAVDVLGGSPTDSSGIIHADCSTFLGLLSSITLTISIGEGLGGASSGARQMVSGTTATALNYQLYRDAARSQVLGSNYWSYGGAPITLNDASLLNLLTTTGLDIPIYGRVSGGQAGVAPGSYASVFSRDPTDVRVDYRTCNLLLLCVNRSASFSFTVSATVPPDCLVTAGDLDFGTTGVLSAALDATSAISVTCTLGSAFDVGLNYGFYGSGPGDRQMRSTAGDAVSYRLYRDAARSLDWGTLADGLAQAGAGQGAAQAFTVYGRVPAQATPPPGAYSDTVVVTVTY
ncbi:SCPU domain-containing protein [Sinirhodobacter ferrireducens]|uniref:SCPU domain-containing protein n=1 Tax=Paenirhodobacter ferrireducens TaxID=1215032 RepID=A0A443L9C0_9RHOB|nr:spore coat U domain-containing protein [Sinirhodobacter ferrireducens]RWR45739.1 SCPU domain-containing protein [Sinirhodobacter ferrireducens]